MLDIIPTKEWTTRVKPIGRVVNDVVPNIPDMKDNNVEQDDGKTLSDYATSMLDKMCAWRRDDE